MIKIEKLVLMKGKELIAAADELGVKVNCNKERTNLKEKKSVVIERLTNKIKELEAEKKETKKESMTSEERKAKRRAQRLERNARNMLATEELRKSGVYEFNGKEQSLTEWSKELGISRKNLYRRVHYLGWTIERAFTTK